MSVHADTRSSPASGEGIDVSTLMITAAASAAAAYACSRLWAPGTLASAAFTPVLVAIIKEALRRPTQAVTRAVPVRGVVRSSPPPAQGGGAPEPSPPPEPPLERVPQPGEVTYHSTGSSARRWRVAIVTGLLGFVVAVLVLTVPELVAGQSASGGGRSTTLFGGHERESKQRTHTTTAPAETVTAPAPKTVTVPAPGKATTTPGTTTTPTTATTVPTTTTTTPTVTQPPHVQP